MKGPDSFSLYTAIPLESASNSWNDLNSMVFGSFHHALQTAFLPVSLSTGLLTIVAICSAVFRRMDHTHVLILIPLKKMDFHQVMVHPV